MAGLSAQEELIVLRKRARRRLVGAVVLVCVATTVLWKVVGRVQEQPMKPESVLVVGVTASGAQAKPAAAPASASLVASAPADASADTTVLPESLSTVNKPVAPQARAEASAAAAHRERPTQASAPAARHKADVRAHDNAQPKPATRADAPPAERKAKPKPGHKAPDPAAILEGRSDGADAPDQPAASDGGRSVIQLAALSDPAKADALRAKLSQLGVDAHFSKVQTSKGTATRVRVGPFASKQEAATVLKKLSRAGVSGIIVSVHNQ